MIYGIGTDLIEIQRLIKIDIARLAQKILTANERVSLPQLETKRRETLAGRFAAKEAMAKALGTGIGKDFTWHDVEIIPDERGKPQMVLSDLVQKRLLRAIQCRAHLSITHTDQYAMAMVVLEVIHND